MGVTGRAAVGSAGPPRATTKAVHPLRPSGGRLSICGQFVIDAKGAWTPVSKDAERKQPSAMRLELLELTGQSSLPHVFIGGKHVGGIYTGPPGGPPGLAALQESGELSERLRNAGAF